MDAVFNTTLVFSSSTTFNGDTIFNSSTVFNGDTIFNSSTINHLYVDSSTIQHLYVDSSTISNLYVITSTIQNLTVDSSTINNLYVDSSTVNNLTIVSNTYFGDTNNYYITGEGDAIFHNVTTTNLSVIANTRLATTTVSALVIGGETFSSLLGTGLANIGGTLSLATSFQDGSVYDSRFVNVSGDTMTGDLNFGSAFRVRGLMSPALESDAATKGYVDGLVSGLRWVSPVLARTTTPPGSPVSGDRYIVIATADGAFAGYEDFIAQYNGASWDFVTSTTNTTAFVTGESISWTFDGADWIVMSGVSVAHNNTTGIQGGSLILSEFYHLTLSEHSRLAGASGFLNIATSTGLFLMSSSTNVSGWQAVGSSTVRNSLGLGTMALENSEKYLTTTTASSTYLKISAPSTTLWDTAVAWGNHALANYLTTSTNLTVSNFLSGNISQWTNDAEYISSTQETDQVFVASAAYGITGGAISNWNSAYNIVTASSSNWTSAYNIVTASSSYWDLAHGWGNHALAGYLTAYTETDPIWSAASSSYLTTTTASQTYLAITTAATDYLSLSSWFSTTTLPSNILLSSLTQVGTITTGTWHGAVVGTGYGGTNTSTLGTAGTLAYSDGSGYAFTASTSLFWDNTNGRFGIGTSSPVSSLSVTGNSYFAGSVTSTGNLRVEGAVGFGSDLSVAGTSTLRSIIPDMIGGTGNMSLYNFGASTTRWSNIWAQYYNVGTSTYSIAADNGKFGIFDSAGGGGNNRLSIDSSGRVGINSSSPFATLSVKGLSGNIPMLTVVSSTGASAFHITAGGDVGIGTITPGAKLDITGSARVNGNFYGNNGITNLTNLGDILNVNKNLGSDNAGSWSTGRSGVSVSERDAVLFNSKIYYLFGTAFSIYDISANTWGSGASTASVPANSTRVLYNGKIYSWGGIDGSDTVVNTMKIYDIVNNSWSDGTAGGTARWGGTSVMHNGKIYIFAGFTDLLETSSDVVDIYDIANGSWSTGASSIGLDGYSASVVYNHKIYIFDLGEVSIYDVATNSWDAGNSGGSALNGRAAVLYNGKVYLRGYDSGDIMDIYDITSDSWSTGTPGSSAKSNYTATIYNGSIYYYGGIVNSTVLDIYNIGDKQSIFTIQENGKNTLSFITGSILRLSDGRFSMMGGNVGINTTTLSARFTVDGSIYFAGTVTTTGAQYINGTLTVNGVSSLATTTITSTTIATANIATANIQTANITTSTLTSSSIATANITALNFVNATGTNLQITNNLSASGTLAVSGATNFYSTLGVYGTTTLYSSLIVNGALSLATTTISTLAVNNTTTLAVSSGNVGIGTSTPTSKLFLTGGNFTQIASDPTLAASVSLGEVALDVAVSGNYAYVAGVSSLKVVDISNPKAPTVVGTENTTSTRVIKIAGKYAYAGGLNGLLVYDISDPHTPVLFGSTNTGLVRDVDVVGRYAYVSANSGAFQIFDISSSSAPYLVGNYFPDIGYAMASYINGKYAYVSLYTAVHILDISDPLFPQLVKIVSLPLENTSKLAIKGKYAYLCGGDDELKIIDISNPAEAVVTSTFTIGYPFPDIDNIVISGAYAYVGSNGILYILDISNPITPRIVGSLGASLSSGFAVSGKYIYGAYSTDFSVIDISGIETPAMNVGSINSGDLTIVGNADIGNNLNIRSALSVGNGGILSNGIIAIAASSSATGSLAAFTVNQNGVGYSALFNGGAVGIGTSTPTARLSVDGTMLVTGQSVLATTTILGRLGVNTTTPEFALDLYGDGGIIARGTFGSGNVFTDVTGDSNFLWYPRKAAFRVGAVNSSHWADANIGDYSSVVGGLNNIAQGAYSFVGGGTANSVSGAYSFIGGGTGNTAQGVYTVAFGRNMYMVGDNSFGVNLSASTTQSFEVYQTSTMAIMGGNVGIGTTSPAYNLDIYASSTASPLRVGSSATSSMLVIDANGFVGVNTSTPISQFSVAGNSYFAGSVTSTGNLRVEGAVDLASTLSVTGISTLATTTITSSSITTANIITGNITALNFTNATGTGNLFVTENISASGTLAITGATNFYSTFGVFGASNIYSSLNVSGAVDLTSTLNVTGISTLATTTVSMLGVGTTTPLYLLDVYSESANNSPLRVGSSATSSMLVVDSNGLVGINNAAPATLTSSYNTILDMVGGILMRSNSTTYNTVSLNAGNTTASGTPNVNRLRFGGNDTPSRDYFTIQGAGDVDYLTINDGNIGIGTTTPGYGLTVIGSMYVSGTTTLANASISSITITGTSTLYNILPAGPYTGNMAQYNLGASTSRWSNLWAQYVNVGTSTFSLNGDNGNFGITDRAGGSGTNRLSITSAGNVGIGTSSPVAKFTMVGGSLLAMGSIGDPTSPPVSGAGSRMMWVPGVVAFRAGEVNGSQWDSSNIGSYSFSVGRNTTAFGSYASAFGNGTVAYGDYSFAGGNTVTSSGDYSFVFGSNGSVVSGDYSASFGYNVDVIGNKSFGFGENISISGDYSFIGGNDNSATGDYSFVFGKNNTSTGPVINMGRSNHATGDVVGFVPQWYGIAIGDLNEAHGDLGSIALGWENTVSSTADRSVTIGYGAYTSAPYSIVFNVATTTMLSRSYDQYDMTSLYKNSVAVFGAPGVSPFHILSYPSGGGPVVANSIDPDTGQWTNPPSDERLKKNITILNGGLERVLKLRPVSFDWKSKESSIDGATLGFIAQDVLPIIPQAVGINKITGFYTLSYDSIIPIAVKAIQEQQAQINSLVSTTIALAANGNITQPSNYSSGSGGSLLSLKSIKSADDKWEIDEDGRFITRLDTTEGKKDMYAMQSPQAEFVFSSSSQLMNGEVRVDFDTSTREIIDGDTPLKVNVTLTSGEGNGVFVKTKDALGFVVKELGGGSSNASFDWVVVAKRKSGQIASQPPVESDIGSGADQIPTIEPIIIPSSTDSATTTGEFVTSTSEQPPEIVSSTETIIEPIVEEIIEVPPSTEPVPESPD